MIRLSKSSDAILAIFVVIITAMLLIPLPTLLLDFLLVINISFSLLLLLVGLYMPNSMAMLAFPSLLLLTTLFRLGLNVASSRLILLQGYAGEVIQAFGGFLIRGEVVVGVIIFVIVTIVNFIVVARGSSRVAEVAARFALDALPGKQMAIDSDLRAGLISAEDARRRRDELRKESQLFGSMDGAMKFVQGDAIAGFFIIVTNIVGGIYLGISRGMGFSDSVNTYTLLTVGDGLVTQIPALLISTCAGIVVTRVSSSDVATLGFDVGKQLFGKSETMIMAGVLAAFIGLLPGLPAVPFILVGSTLAFAGYYIQKNAERKQDQINTGLKEDFRDTDKPHQIAISLDPGVLYRLYSLNRPDYRLWWSKLVKDFYGDVGMLLPDVAIIKDKSLPASTYALSVCGTRIETGKVPLDSILVEVSPANAEIFGFEVLDSVNHPVSGTQVFWTPVTPAVRSITARANLATLDFMQFLFLKIAVFCQYNSEEIFGVSEVNGLLKELERTDPSLVREVLDKKLIDLPRLTQVLQQLMKEGIKVRNLKQILESIAAYYASRSQEEDFFSLDDLVSFVRMNRRRHHILDLVSERRTIKVIELSPDVELALEQIGDNSGNTDRSSSSDPEMLKRGLQGVINTVVSKGIPPVSIMCNPDIRMKVVEALRRFDANLSVITHNEAQTDFRMERVGTWNMG